MRFVLLLALVIPLAACGGKTGGGSGAGADASLTITMWPGGVTGPKTTSTVTCPGDDPCAELAKLPLTAFDPTPRNIMCTDIYGGPEVAHVVGTVHGESIDSMFKRTDGCETGRWDRVAFLFKT